MKNSYGKSCFLAKINPGIRGNHKTKALRSKVPARAASSGVPKSTRMPAQSTSKPTTPPGKKLTIPPMEPATSAIKEALIVVG